MKLAPTRRLVRLVALISFASASLLPGKDAVALTAIELSVNQLVTASTLVVHAQPSESLGVWEDADGARARRIVTYTRLDVLDVLDGQVPSDPVWVRTLGGRVGDIAQRVEGEAVLVRGQPSVFFLSRRPDATYVVVGMAQGHYPVESPAAGAMEGRTMRALHVDAVVPRPGHSLREPSAARVALTNKTIGEVRALIAATRGRDAR